MNSKEHIVDPQGRDKHLKLEEHAAATRAATDTLTGLMPAGILYGVIFFEPPHSATSFGRKGMQAFDDEYYYLCFDESKWRRKQLEDF